MHAQCQWNGLGVRPKTSTISRAKAASVDGHQHHRCPHQHRKLLENGPKPVAKARKLELCGYISTQTFSDVHGLCEYLFKAERRKCRVLYDYSPQNEDELELEVGDIIEFLEEVEEGWWKGILKGRMGVFPSNFVGPEIEPKSSSEKQQHEDHKRKASSSPKTVPDSTSNGGLAGLKSKAPALFQKDEKKPSSSSTSSILGKVSPKSAIKSDPDAPKLPPKPIRELAKVLFSYEAQNDDELSIKEGDTIVILTKEVEDKGWWKGELNGRVGVFPDNFVQLLKDEASSGHSSPQPGQTKPERPDKPAKALKPELPKEKPLIGFNPPNQPLPPLPTEAKGDHVDKPISKVSPFGSMDPCLTERLPISLNATKPVLPSHIKKQNGTSAASVIASLAAEKANQNGHQADVPASSVVVTGDGSTLDSIESSETKLKHPTADRARPPARRPPSHIGSPPGTKEPSILEENGEAPPPGLLSAPPHLNGGGKEEASWLKDLKKSPKFNGVPSSSTSSHTAHTTALNGPPSGSGVPTGPSPQVINLRTHGPSHNGNRTTPPRQDDVDLTKNDANHTGDHSESRLNGGINEKRVNEAIKNSQRLENEVIELRAELKKLRENSVSKHEFAQLAAQMDKLQETMEANRAHYAKMVRELMTEVDEEKKHRMTLQVEIDRLKKITVTV